MATPHFNISNFLKGLFDGFYFYNPCIEDKEKSSKPTHTKAKQPDGMAIDRAKLFGDWQNIFSDLNNSYHKLQNEQDS